MISNKYNQDLEHRFGFDINYKNYIFEYILNLTKQNEEYSKNIIETDNNNNNIDNSNNIINNFVKDVVVYDEIYPIYDEFIGFTFDYNIDKPKIKQIADFYIKSKKDKKLL